MLRKHYKFFIFIFATVAVMEFITPRQCIAADDAYTTFVQANQLYKGTNYSKAISLYNKAASLGFAPGGLYYNLGNAYYRNGNLGKSIASYLRAEQLLPRNSDVLENLNIARAQTIDKVLPAAPPAALRQFLFLYYKFSLDELLWMTAILLAALFILLSIYTFFRISPIRSFIKITVIILIIIGATAGVKFHHLLLHSTAVVISKEAVVRAGPGDSYAEIFVIHNGTEIKILEKKENSAKIRVDKKKGWINVNDIDIIQLGTRKMRTKLTLIIFSILCITISSVYAKEKNPEDYSFIEWEGWGDWNGTMTGRITDKDGDPIPYAKIKVHSKNIKTTTDKNGYFSIKGLQQGGHYSLIVKGKGFDGAVARWIPVPISQSADIGNFSLEPEHVWTNFWVVTSNALENGTWVVVSNFFDIADDITNIYNIKDYNFFKPVDLHIYDYTPETNTIEKVEKVENTNTTAKTIEAK